jgi:hypothetical protein
MDWFNRFMRTSAAPLALLFIKLFTALRTGLDTLIVLKVFEANVSMIQFVNAIIYVSLIDLVFTGLWFYAAYGGDSKQAALLRPYAIAGAWVLYIGMIIVGWAAHPESPYLALLSRVAGGVALGYDTSSVLSPTLRSIYEFFATRIRERNRAKGPEETYQRIVKETMVGAIESSKPAMKARIVTALESRFGELDDVVYGILPTPDSFTENDQSEAENKPPMLPGKVPIGFVLAVQDSWNTCRNVLVPNEIFTRAQIEQCTALGRSRATDVINYGIEVGEARRIGKGRYIYHPIQQGIVVEETNNPAPPNIPEAF